MSAVRDITGQRCGFLTATWRFPSTEKGRQSRWSFSCDCGRETSSLLTNVTTGKMVSCGCYKQSVITKHAMYKTLEYSTWASIRERCTNQKSKNYARYGGAGISMYQEWVDSFSAFYAYVGNKPSKQHSIDRIDVYGNYEPGNVRWATIIQQARNKKNSKYVVLDGTRVPLMQASDETGIPYTTIVNRMRRGESPEEAIRHGSRRS
jgi:hypothetical protein